MRNWQFTLSVRTVLCWILPANHPNYRWLARKKGRAACVEVLQRLRNIPADHPYLLEEIHSIFQQLEHEEAIAEGTGFKPILKEIAKSGNRKRLGIGSLMFVFMQMAGSNAINYYSPAIFRSIGLTGSNTGLFATGIYGAVRFVAILFSMIFVVDRFGRTRALMAGSAVMVSFPQIDYKRRVTRTLTHIRVSRHLQCGSSEPTSRSLRLHPPEQKTSPPVAMPQW